MTSPSCWESWQAEGRPQGQRRSPRPWAGTGGAARPRVGALLPNTCLCVLIASPLTSFVFHFSGEHPASVTLARHGQQGRCGQHIASRSEPLAGPGSRVKRCPQPCASLAVASTVRVLSSAGLQWPRPGPGEPGCRDALGWLGVVSPPGQLAHVGSGWGWGWGSPERLRGS